MARVAVMVHTMAVFATWKWSARVSTRKTTTKKSNASRVQPKKLAATACHASDREGGNIDAAVEFESLSLFPSGTGTCLAEEVYTADLASHQGTRRSRGTPLPWRAQGFYLSTPRNKYNEETKQ